MYLSQMQDIVAKYCDAISKVLGVDVLIVDRNLDRVGNTFRYPNAPVPIRRLSMIGQVITEGKPLTIDDKSTYHACQKCPDLPACSIEGFIGVPIHFGGEVVGAIALLIPTGQQQFFHTMRNAVEFLEKMAELLSGKIQNICDYEKLNEIKREREVLIDSMEDAIVSTDIHGAIQYCNKSFQDCFGVGRYQRGERIADVINHPLIREAVDGRISFTNKLICCQGGSGEYYGFASCTHLMLGGVSRGMLFSFRSIRKFNNAFNEVGDNRTIVTFSDFGSQNSKSMRSVVSAAKRLAVTDHTITILGEEGVGKENMAKSIHSFSDRSQDYFVTVDCKELSYEEQDKSIFGSTGSDNLRSSLGKLWYANKGTIYFENVDHLSLYLQQKIVGFMKDRRLGQADGGGFEIDVRMIFSATSNLRALLKNGLLDEELYYRISENVLQIPPLRERPEDVLSCMIKNLRFFSGRYRRKDVQLSDALVRHLKTYHWPGNLKELTRVAERLVLSFQGEALTPDDVPYLAVLRETAEPSLEEIERQYIADMLAQQKNKNEIASILNISRATLYRKLKKYDMPM